MYVSAICFYKQNGPIGYNIFVAGDIGIIGKGDTVKMQLKSEKDHDDIEAYVIISWKIIFYHSLSFLRSEHCRVSGSR